MRILFLYRFIKEYDFDHYLHMSFVKALSKISKDIKIFSYGPGLRQAYPETTLFEYNPRLSFETLYEMLHFDLIIFMTKSRCFTYYNPKKDEAQGCWLPTDTAKFNKVPKIVLEEDYHYEKNDFWYREMGISLILQRHKSQVLRKQEVPMAWLPFSVDPLTFKDNGLNRENKIAFIGNNADEAYVYRKNAITNLVNANLGANYAGSKKVNNDYLEVLQKYIGYISCGSIYDITAAKNFEIMASGGILFTNSFLGIDYLFPNNSYVSYSNDASDIVQKAKNLLNNVYQQKEIRELAQKVIKTRHTHEIRLTEMLNIIKEMA